MSKVCSTSTTLTNLGDPYTGCRFNDVDCQHMWKVSKNRFGYCKGSQRRFQTLCKYASEGVPSNFSHDNVTEGAKSVQLVLNYNLDDWSNGGWTHFLEGYTIFLSTADDQSFSIGFIFTLVLPDSS